MPTPMIAFDSVDLEPYVGTWQEQANSRINAVTVPRRHGALVTDTIVEDVRTIQLTGRIQDDDQLELRNKLDLLSELFTRRNKRLQLWDDRYIIADKAQWGFAYVPGSALRAADFSLQFFCPDPFWYGTVASDVDYDLAQTDIPIDITNNIYRRLLTINNDGGVYVYPTITVTPGLTPLTRVIARNMTNGRMFQYTGTVAPGTTLVINMAAFTVENNGVEDLNNFINSDFWAFEPGDNSIQIEGTAPANYDFGFTKRFN